MSKNKSLGAAVLSKTGESSATGATLRRQI